MVENNQVTLKGYDGPGLIAPFAAVVVEFTSRFDDPLPSIEVERSLNELMTPDATLALNFSSQEIALPELVAMLANAWQDVRGVSDLPVAVKSIGPRRWRVALGFHDVEVASTSLQAGLEFAEAVFGAASGGAMNVRRLRAINERVMVFAGLRQPDRISRLLIGQAKQRDVPVHSFWSGSRIWVYGQGAQSHRFFEATTYGQSMVGVELARDKVHSKRYLARIGFPVAPYGVADNLKLAREIASGLGYPLVTKPPDRGRGTGVTIGIDNAAEFEAAFHLAKQESRNGLVLIERHIAGDHFRLSVFGGRHKRNARHSAATVVGDGASSVAELIAAENDRRTPEEFAAGAVQMKLEIDTAMLAVLAKQGYALDDRPPKGAQLVLSKTSNMATGGRFRDATADTHPDIIAMAEAVARCFRLDAAGIDFISPDITKSWRDGECAIIEINGRPGIASHFLAERVFSAKFPEGSNGRIPCMLVIDDEDALAAAVAERLKGHGTRVGFAGNKTTSLAGDRRFIHGGDLPTRILSLVFDPGCDALVVACRAADIENHGLPHARFDVALLAEPLTPELRALATDHVANCIDVPSKGDIGAVADAAIAALRR